MNVVATLAELGGTATRAELIEALDRKSVDHALRVGLVVAESRGRYVLPGADDTVRAAHRLGGTLSRQSAALHHGWKVKTVPVLPHVSLPRKRKVTTQARRGVVLHRDDWGPDDVDGIATSVEATLDQCLRLLPWDEALAIADSALREGVSPATLKRVGLSARGTGAPQARRVLAEARAEAANPFESVLRAIALDVPGLNVRPQVTIRGERQTARCDLVDADLLMALEADSFEWHGGRADLQRDARRYDELVVDGWLVLRFAYEHVMHDQDWVAQILRQAVARRTGCTCGGCTCAGPRRQLPA